MNDNIDINTPGSIDTEHYLRAVSDLGDTHVVTTGEAIFSASGIKLVEKGAQVDSRLYERLVQHKLSEPIDSKLTVQGAVDVSAILAAATALVKDAPLPRMLASGLTTAVELIAPLGRIVLPPPMAFKLTLMREQNPSLWQHSLEMALVAIFLGIRSGMRPSDCEQLAAAALLHDMGMLHMDPAWRDPQYRLAGSERKQLVAHPITSMLLIRNCKAYPKEVEIAVLEHHERHDGSGYPRGLRAAAISPMGKILLVAEVVSAFFEKYVRLPAQRLSLVLRLKHRMFDPALIGHLMPLLRAETQRESTVRPWTEAEHQSELLGAAVEKWSGLKIMVPPEEFADGATGPFKLLDSRMQSLVHSLTEAGNQPEAQAALLESLGDDAEGRAELALIGREALWEVRAIMNACDRRWPDLAQQANLTEGQKAVVEWCAWVEENLPPLQQASVVQPLI
jgi:HD-GYP domain-containing protein (c-di-GMP phosphodiesterase class II)